MFDKTNFTPKTPYNIPNNITSPAAQQRNIINGIAFQGYTFNIVNGASVQNLQLPGDCTEILGFIANIGAVNAGFNTQVIIAVNNQNIFSSVGWELFNSSRFLVAPGYIPVNKLVSPTSILNMTFNNGTGATLLTQNFMIAYH